MPGAGSIVTQLKKFWYIAAESDELGSRPVSKTVLGEHLVLLRQADGVPAALIDRCAHRNMALSLGRLQDGVVECPYHGWRYRGDGQCVYIPSLPRNETTAAAVRVRAYPCVQSDGYIWVYMGEAQPTRSPPRFSHLGESGWTSFRMKTRFPAGALACLENFLDCPHTVYVHRGWFRSPHVKETRAEVTRSALEIEARFFAERDAQSVISRLLFPRRKDLLHTDRFAMPSTSRVDYVFGPARRFIITSQCTPVTDSETDVYTVVSFRFGRIGGLVRLLFEPLSRKIIRQDVEILRRQTQQVERFGGEDFTFVKSDLIGPDILRLWREALKGEDERSFNGRVETRNVTLRF